MYKSTHTLYSREVVFGSMCDVTAIAVENFNNDQVVTIFSSGYPMIHMETDEVESDEQGWPYLILEPLTSGWQQAHVELLLNIGEITEDAQQKYVAAIGSENEQEAFNWVTSDGMSGDGHEICALVDEAQQALHAYKLQSEGYVIMTHELRDRLIALVEGDDTIDYTVRCGYVDMLHDQPLGEPINEHTSVPAIMAHFNVEV
jgi:hypothetical protein